VWGLKVCVDPLTDFFRHFISKAGLSDLTTIKLIPTWRNNRTRKDRIAKQLDRFLVTDNLLIQPLHLRQWIGFGGDSDHSPIFFEIFGGPRKPPSPFKFNPTWAQEESFQTLVKECWEPFFVEGGEVAGIQFAAKLKRVKKEAMRWEKEKKERDVMALKEIEEALQGIYDSEGKGYNTP